MADLWVTAFLPDEWSDFVSLTDALFPSGVALWRWEEVSYDDGNRRRAAEVVRAEDGPSLDDVRTLAVAEARARGFRVQSITDEATTLEDGARTLTLSLAPLPPRLAVELQDRVTHRGAELYPAIADVFRMAAHAGAARFAKLARFAELDLETHTRFFPPRVEMTARGSYDRAALCEALAAAGFEEDGDAWIRHREATRDEVRLSDEMVVAAVVPHHLCR